MSTFTFLCLLLHHGVWNEPDHDVFKSIIATCKRIHQYLCSNKPLVQMLFGHLVIHVDRWVYGRLVQYWMLNHKREGVILRWLNISKKQLYSRGFCRNNVLHGEYTQLYEDGQIMIHEFYRNGLNHGEFKSWFRNGQIGRSQFFQDGLMIGNPIVWDSNGNKLFE